MLCLSGLVPVVRGVRRGGGGVCSLRLICRFFGKVFLGPKGVWVLEQGKGPGNLFRSAACWSFGLVYLRDGNCEISILGEVVLKEACVCPAENALVVGVELCVDDLLVVGASNGDGGGEFDFDWGVHGGYHGVCVGFFMEMTKLVSCVDVFLRRWDRV